MEMETFTLWLTCSDPDDLVEFFREEGIQCVGWDREGDSSLGREANFEFEAEGDLDDLSDWITYTHDLWCDVQKQQADDERLAWLRDCEFYGGPEHVYGNPS